MLVTEPGRVVCCGLIRSLSLVTRTAVATATCDLAAWSFILDTELLLTECYIMTV